MEGWSHTQEKVRKPVPWMAAVSFMSDPAALTFSLAIVRNWSS